MRWYYLLGMLLLRIVNDCAKPQRQGVSDKYSWVTDSFKGEGSPLLWDDKFNKKAAYRAVLNAITAG
jgi:endo-1,4-beta-xylanase